MVGPDKNWSKQREKGLVLVKRRCYTINVLMSDKVWGGSGDYVIQ